MNRVFSGFFRPFHTDKPFTAHVYPSKTTWLGCCSVKQQVFLVVGVWSLRENRETELPRRLKYLSSQKLVSCQRFCKKNKKRKKKTRGTQLNVTSYSLCFLISYVEKLTNVKQMLTLNAARKRILGGLRTSFSEFKQKNTWTANDQIGRDNRLELLFSIIGLGFINCRARNTCQ